MSIDKVNIQSIQPPKSSEKSLPVIDPKDIRAILYLGIRGNISVPTEKHKVDILA